MNEISIIVPGLNEQGNLVELVNRIDKTAKYNNITYELIFIDYHSTDKSVEIICSLIKKFPIHLYSKKGKRGKAQSLLEEFLYAMYTIVCKIDAAHNQFN